MKIQLIHAPRLKGKSNPNYPPLGLLYLASYVRSLYPDVKFKITDGLLIGEKSIDDFRRFKPDLVGVSFSTSNASGAYMLINALKEERPDIPVVCGGVHPSAFPEEVCLRTNADIVVVGEGEKALAQIVHDLLNGKELKDSNRIIVSQPIKDINSIPFPARDLVNLSDYPGALFRKVHPETHMLSSRGCPYRCWFCSNPVWKTTKPYCRLRTPNSVGDEIQLLKEKYGVKEFFDQCDEFNVNLKNSIEICNEIIRRKLDIYWKVQMTSRRLNFSEELVRKMAESGCWLVYLGIESGNQSTLNGIGKQISIEDVKSICSLFKKYGVKVFGLFMLFNVWEENGQLRYENVQESIATLKFAESLRKQKLLDYLSCTITTPFPASPLWDTSMKFNLIPKDYIGRWELWDMEWSHILRLPGISENEWKKVREEGARLQTRSVLSNLMDVNPKAINLYMEKARRMLNSWVTRFQW